MDSPLSSILRPGPAAPSDEQARRETPVEGGDADARPAESQNTYRPPYQGEQPASRTLQDPDAAARAAQEATASLRQPQYVRPLTQQPVTQQPATQQPTAQQPSAQQPVTQQPLDARAAAYQTPRDIRPAAYQPQQDARPAAQQAQAARPAQQHPAAVDDIVAGLEAAALRDIGDAMKTPDARTDDGAEDGEKRRGKQNGASARAGGKQMTKTERQARRAEKLKHQDDPTEGVSLPATTTTSRAVDRKVDKKAGKREKQKSTAAPREWGIPWTAISFLAMVLIPAAIATLYYVFMASPQYQVETQFAVRGANQSSAAAMGLGTILGGTSVQTSDSYIVTSYAESAQLIRDVHDQLGIDLRQFYTRADIDWFYRIDPDMPLEKFTEYWRSMTDVSFNATTGNTTLYVYAFSAEDSKAIADAVLKVSERLVNDLSESNRQQVMQVASKQVDRAEERLRKVQGEIRKLRQTEQTTDPSALISIQTDLQRSLQSQLMSLKTRMGALLKSVNPDAPQAKALQKQIDSIEGQLAEHEAQLGSSKSKDPKSLSPEERANLADVLNKFEELNIEQTFATQAYTTALSAFETAIVEAQRQERYFATFVAPTRPEIALYPMRYLDSFIAFLVLLAAWMATQFVYRSFRDHAI